MDLTISHFYESEIHRQTQSWVLVMGYFIKEWDFYLVGSLCCVGKVTFIKKNISGEKGDPYKPFLFHSYFLYSD